MAISRRQFFQTTGTALAASSYLQPRPVKAHFRVKSENQADATTVSDGGGMAVAIPSSMAMDSGAPLGGIGTGFVELRPDGCFHEWQIFNAGHWSPHRPKEQAGVEPPVGPQSLQFLIRSATQGRILPQLRRLYLRSQENDLYSLAYAQDVESIDYEAMYPLTTLRFHDPTLPVEVSAAAFSPFIPGNARVSATPGFHYVISLHNGSKETVDVSLLSVLANPLAWGLEDRQLSNTLRRQGASTSLVLKTDAQPENKSAIGSLCLSVTGGDHSWITGTFQPYALPGLCRWASQRLNYMLLDLLQEYYKTGKLPNTEADGDPSNQFNLTDGQIDALSSRQIETWITRLCDDALFNRVISDARAADPQAYRADDLRKTLLKEIRRNLTGVLASGKDRGSSWGTGALASSVRLAPGQTQEIRFALSWFFPHHFSGRGQDMGHMYANWFKDAAEVNQFLLDHYGDHRAGTEEFAHVLADTSLDSALAFSWSSQLSTLVTNTWWVKDGGYAIWEGLGCCGLSTTDVDFDGSFPIVALFPELKLGQMKRMIAFQNASGEVPHNYAGDFDHIDPRGWGRVDMNPQFVMMVCRDSLWTGDQEYLQSMWPHVVRAMEHTASLDSDGDGLPDRDCGFQTYDQWRMRGAPSYIASLWIGALRAAIRLAQDLDKKAEAQRWQAALDTASASFDRILFNSQYYSLWVDKSARDETCMTDQISGEWFSHLIGLPTTISEKNLSQAVESIWKNNFTAETGLRNASVPKGGPELLVLENLQAGGVWSGIEFAFASFLMDHGRYEDGAAIVAAVHRRYLRAGMPWNHVECGSHYSRAMASWATLLAATGFKPDMPNQSLAIVPGVRGDFRAPWVTSTGFGRITRSGQMLAIACQSGSLTLKTLKVNLANADPQVHLEDRLLDSRTTRDGSITTIQFVKPVSINRGQTLSLQ
jgi:uncharacterized protein (DUF608 family)